MNTTNFAADLATEYSHQITITRSSLVTLSTIRACFPELTRSEFDAALSDLRDVSDEWVLQSFEGRHGELTEGLSEAAITEAGRTFHYLARRTAE